MKEAGAAELLKTLVKEWLDVSFFLWNVDRGRADVRFDALPPGTW
ncbi:hypothetical protein RBSH_05144 [Rhodopirellula baltica SH28]|uniref:Uncharacterized protein n=2 Tax=Rhodopirellula baltica TaxID=265606 RepID=F2AZP9_RHOBT|nr:hypothetical protein RBWH47_05285 [Rhodopirellula baltica WH47]EKJ99581.1 hypothetical protein RBSH_05144 [Rhodopirellula baltica SH28]